MSKKKLYIWHKRIGLSLGLILFVLGLSGAVVTYRDELLPKVYPEIFYVSKNGERLPIEKVLVAAKTHLDERNFTHLYTSERDDTATMIFTKKDGSLLPDLVTINPYDASVVGEMPLIQNIFGVMLYVHANLLLGKLGGYLVGLMGLLLCLFFITGIIIYWGNNISSRFRRLPKSGLRGLHRGVGIFLGLPLVFSGVTGFILAFDLLGDKAKPADMNRMFECVWTDQLKAMNLLSAPQKSNIVSIHFCSSKNSLMKVSYGHSSRNGHEGFSKVIIDPQTQKVLQSFDTRKDPPAWSRNALTIYPLHTGSYFGEAGRLLTLLTGFALMSLYVTGLFISLKARRQKITISVNDSLSIQSPRHDLV